MSTRITSLPSDHDIIRLCADIQSSGDPRFLGPRVVNLSESLVVKFGLDVTKPEAETQAYARRYVDSTILYIPQVFRFFQVTFHNCTYGYRVMELINGTNLQDLDLDTYCGPDVVKMTIEAMQHLRSIPLLPPLFSPGPVGGGPARGYLWSDNGSVDSLKSVEDMEKWINRRLDVLSQPHVSLCQYKLSMCHMDLAGRNIFLLPNSTICLVDWEFAGFYPAIFEIHHFNEIRRQDELWVNKL